jgi:PAS domain S-box-containing protein
MTKVEYEVKCAYQEVIVSRTDIKGNIIYYNSTFSKVNGFKGASVINQPHNIIRHPDMPKTIFNIVWKVILNGFPIQAIVKNKTKDNKYYWTMLQWKPQRDKNNNIVSFVAEGKQAPEKIIKIIEPLYSMLHEIEKEHGMESAIRYLHSYLDEKGMTYSQYLSYLSKHRGMRCLCEFVRVTKNSTK